MKPLPYCLPKHPFGYVYLMDQLKAYHSPRAKITRMLAKGEIIRIKKGLYILAPDYGGEVNKLSIGNLIYGPSYVSLEYALSYWGLIPERVEEVTCITDKRRKRFDTPLGVFSYTYLNTRAYSIGVNWEYNPPNSFFIASKEKALCDKIAGVKNLNTPKDIDIYLEEDLRVDREELKDLDYPLLQEIRDRYKKKSITQFVDWYFEYNHGRSI